MAKARRKQAKVDVGLAHVEAALEMVAQILEDIRLVVAEMRRREKARADLAVPIPPGLPCVPKRPGDPCIQRPGEPCRTRPGDPCIRRPGEPCRKLVKRPTRR